MFFLILKMKESVLFLFLIKLKIGEFKKGPIEILEISILFLTTNGNF